MTFDQAVHELSEQTARSKRYCAWLLGFEVMCLVTERLRQQLETDLDTLEHLADSIRRRRAALNSAVHQTTVAATGFAGLDQADERTLEEKQTDATELF